MSKRSSSCNNPLCSCDPCTCTDCRCEAAKLSNLERRIMDLVWESAGADVTVRGISREIPEYAYTTVATIMDRLVRKGVLRCRLVGRAKHYEAIGSRGAHTAVVMYEALMTDEDPESALRRFVNQLSDAEALVVREALAPGAAGTRASSRRRAKRPRG